MRDTPFSRRNGDGAVDLLLEIGTEELPASAVYEGIEQTEKALPHLFERSRLDFEGLRVIASPRRLSAVATGVAGKARGEIKKKKGPLVSTARNPDGSWSKAAVGFARSQGVEPEALVEEETPKGGYFFAVTEAEGLPAREVLPGLLAELVASLKFGKSMRWGEGEERFSRPVRWLLALLDDEVLEFGFAGLESSNITYGHRYLSDGNIEVSSPGSYERLLEEACVVADHARRREIIVRTAGEVCREEGLLPVWDEGVLSEVVQLVEWPGVVLGRFDDRFLELPREVLVHAMEEHQRYFPVGDHDGAVKAGFLAVHNGDPAHSDTIRKGHERVLAARLADADFFYREDLKRPLADRRRDLEHVVYQSVLGSMAEKSARLARLVGRITGDLGLDVATAERAVRAAELAKCDLVTHMVVEFPSLQGTVGSIYARLTGEDERVAAAIAEQYLPRRLGDALPGSTEGAVLSLAEKADNLAASFGLGHVPTGSEDPYALRRQSLGILLIVVDRGLALSVSDLVGVSAAEIEAEAHGFTWTEEANAGFSEFFTGRERVFFTERGYRYDLVEAALSLGWDRPLSVQRRLDSLLEARESGLLARLYTGFERCHNLSRGVAAGEVREALVSEDAERDVLRLLADAEREVAGALDATDFKAALGALEPLCAPIDTLFDDVLIMAEDPEVRSNRLSLLSRVVELFNTVADFKALAWD